MAAVVEVSDQPHEVGANLLLVGLGGTLLVHEFRKCVVPCVAQDVSGQVFGKSPILVP